MKLQTKITLNFDNGKEENINFKTDNEAMEYIQTLVNHHPLIGRVINVANPHLESFYFKNFPFNFCASINS